MTRQTWEDQETTRTMYFPGPRTLRSAHQETLVAPVAALTAVAAVATLEPTVVAAVTAVEPVSLTMSIALLQAVLASADSVRTTANARGAAFVAHT